MPVLDIKGIKVPTGTHEGKTIVIGADHRGFSHKQRIVSLLKGQGYEVIDVGTSQAGRCDYPPISDALGKEVSHDPLNRVGIGICGSGIGILVPAAKHAGVIPARCLTKEEAVSSRKHNNANLLGIGADGTSIEKAFMIIDAWLTASFYSGKEDAAYLTRYLQTIQLEKLVSDD